MQKEILDYCQYYNGEEQCPYNDSYEARAWAAEQQVCSFVKDDAYSFLSYIVAYISKWDPYEYRSDVARYVAEFGHCSLNEKMQIARTYELGEFLEFDRPKGRTVFEYEWQNAFYHIDCGFYLYFDGRVYEKITTFEPGLISTYVLCKSDKSLADAVKTLIRANYEQIKTIPKKLDCSSIDDGNFSYYKFLSKRCGGYMPEYADEGKELMNWFGKVADIFKEHDICVLYGPPEAFDEEMAFMVNEIQEYVAHGYPDDYDSMCFGAGVDMVKFRLKECKQLPATVTELLTYINETLHTDNEDPRLAPSVAAYLVRQQVISIDDEGRVTWTNNSLQN